MRESFVFTQLRKTEETINKIKRQSSASDQEIITLRLQMNAFVRLIKWLVPFNWLFNRFVKKEYNAYTKGLDDRKKELEKMKAELANKKAPKVVEHIGRNKPCKCGSGKKYKKCCLDKKSDANANQIASKTKDVVIQNKSKKVE